IRALRPAQPTALVRWIPRVLGIALTALTLAAAGWRRRLPGPDMALFVGALIINMLLLSPVCHLHYFRLCVLIVMGLVAVRCVQVMDCKLGIGLTLILVASIICYIPPNIPEWLVLRDLAIMIYPTLMLWAAGTLNLWKRTRQRTPDIGSLDQLSQAA